MNAMTLSYLQLIFRLRWVVRFAFRVNKFTVLSRFYLCCDMHHAIDFSYSWFNRFFHPSCFLNFFHPIKKVII